jgi:polyhydroxybutyrate depolymerase
MLDTARALALAMFVASCNSSPTAAPTSTSTPAAIPRGSYDPVPFGGARAVLVYVPSKYVASKPAPLVILLHGYGSSGGAMDAYLGLRDLAEASGVLYAHPEGTVDSRGRAFWNATDTCCNFDRTPVDDSAYLAALVREIGQRYSVDPKRIYFAGHSNGGFMAYRMACDHADLVAGIVSVAGAMWVDPKKCAPTAAVSVVEIHGTTDSVISYEGGIFHPGFPPYPGATTSVADWARFDGCAAAGDASLPPVDLDRSLPGAETSVTRFAAGCRGGSEVELWTVHGGAHTPAFSASVAGKVLDFLLAHPKP